MKKIYLTITILCSSVVFSAVYGQEKKLLKADKEFQEFSYIDARKIYLDVVESGYESQDVYEKLGDSYYYNADLPNAARWYNKLYTSYSSSISPEYLFRYSQSLKSLKKYEESDKIMEEFNRTTGNNQKRTELFEEERNYLDLIELQSGRFDVKNLVNINTSGSDFGPSLYQKEAMVFASSRNSGPAKIIHEWNEAEFLDLYETKREGANSMNVEGMDKLNNKVNSKFHESTSTFTKDGKTMYFTRNNFTKKRVGADNEGIVLLKLYKAEKLENGKWSNVVELPFNSNDYSVAHPALSPDEKTLYFASDMPGTNGLSDIFMAEIKGNNSFGTPVNLGPNINTEARETFPFVSESGNLFFASDGHVGLGGLDVFVSLPRNVKMTKNPFNEPYNVGAPINTEDDDFAFVIEESTKIGYFTSNRSGGMGGDDIYSLKQLKELITTCNQSLKGLITDAESRSIMPGAVVTLFDDKMNTIDTDTADENGMYQFEIIDCSEDYVIRAQMDGYQPTEINFASNNQFGYENNQPLQLRKGKGPLDTIAANLGDDLAKILQLQIIYFDLDKSFIRPDAEVELQKVISAMKAYPNIKIDVRSHTDSRADFNYNVSLSDRRAKSTIQYIMDKGGIAKERLTGRGYGEIELVNECADGVSCTEAQHQLNRRSEFIIVK